LAVAASDYGSFIAVYGNDATPEQKRDALRAYQRCHLDENNRRRSSGTI
jgi:hypothetical protein